MWPIYTIHSLLNSLLHHRYDLMKNIVIYLDEVNIFLQVIEQN
jgi:hypothetical protein